MAKKQCGIIRISDARSGGKIKSKTQLKSAFKGFFKRKHGFMDSGLQDFFAVI